MEVTDEQIEAMRKSDLVVVLRKLRETLPRLGDQYPGVTVVCREAADWIETLFAALTERDHQIACLRNDAHSLTLQLAQEKRDSAEQRISQLFAA
jgi:hypothetical protein